MIIVVQYADIDVFIAKMSWSSGIFFAECIQMQVLVIIPFLSLKMHLLMFVLS